MRTNVLEISSLTKVFPTPTGPYVAVKDFRARIEPGEFVALLGHSGCGKSTVLSIVAGLQDYTEGGVIVNGKEIDGPGLERALVFQSPSLLPWLTAFENVLLAAQQAHPGKSHAEQNALAMKYMELVGVAEYARQMPAELSQGTQQRVAIARAFSQEPQFLLLDEPFGMLDSITRAELQDLVLDLWSNDPKTVILVTHDIDEAVFLSDRILLMTDGPESRVGLDLPVPLPPSALAPLGGGESRILPPAHGGDSLPGAPQPPVQSGGGGLSEVYSLFDSAGSNPALALHSSPKNRLNPSRA